MKIIGIDLSLTSPACCVFQGDEFNFNGCNFYYLTSNKKLDTVRAPVTGTLIQEYDCDQQRYYNITSWIVSIINSYDPDHIFIEDYSFASTGRVFNIAENCGILKQTLWKNGITFTTIPPTVVKKQATGKGNSNKLAMEAAFIQETGFNIREHLQLSMSVSNPVSDIVDSYYVAKAGLYYEIKQ
jgi:Holliday junction resolvasome RuvABC endonuclease subunit